MKKIRFALPSLFMYLICLVFFIGTFSIKTAVYGNIADVGVGPKFIPYLIIGGLFVLTTKNLMMAWPHRCEAAEEEDKNRGSLVLSILIIAVCSLAVKPLGFIIAGTAFLFGEFVLLEEHRTRKIILKHLISAVAVTLVVFAAFEYGFKMGVPTGTIFY